METFKGSPVSSTARRLILSSTTSSASRLYNYRARYLDPSLGRFLQTDPLGYQDSMNLYQGMNMNLVNIGDPWGEDFVVSVEEWRGDGWGHLVLFYQGGNGLWNRFDMGPKRGFVPRIKGYIPAQVQC